MRCIYTSEGLNVEGDNGRYRLIPYHAVIHFITDKEEEYTGFLLEPWDLAAESIGISAWQAGKISHDNPPLVQLFFNEITYIEQLHYIRFEVDKPD